MSKYSIDEEFNYYIEYLKNYYGNQIKNNDTLTIIGMNDDRGFNIHKNILMNLKDNLESDKYNIELLDMCSMFFNKTRHIDYFLQHNLSLEEIRLMQEYGTTIEMNHAAGMNIPFMSHISKTFNKLMLTKTPTYGNPKSIKISDKIKETSTPLIMYASGLNDIMYELHINPFNLKKSYMEKSKNPKYDYACEKVNEQTIKKIIDGHKKNFESILGLNEKSDIYTLSAYLYSAMNEEYEKKFKEAILMYNENLEKLCSDYNITYINCRFLENTKYNSPLSNYISKYPPQMIAYEIIKKMYNKVINEEKQKNNIRLQQFKYDNDGTIGVINDLKKDIIRCEEEQSKFDGYEQKIYLEKTDEHNRELQVFEQIEETIKTRR